MNIFIKNTLVWAVVIGVNLLLFTFVPAMHSAVVKKDSSDGNKQQTRIIAQVEPPKKEKKKEMRKKPREVKAPSSRGDQGGDRMKMKFTPDLGVASGDGAVVQSEDLEAVVFEEGETDEEAVPVSMSPPEYPRKAREMGLEGTVHALFVIDADGRIRTVEIIESPHPVLSEAARETITGWRFKPARNDGVPVKVRKRIPLEFRLEEG